jgi:hypothetical protein
MEKTKNNKESQVNVILVENVRLTQIENGEVKILGACNAAETDKAKDKIMMKLAIMEEMFASGELVIPQTRSARYELEIMGGKA